MKKVVVISSSLRHNSNSRILAQEFARGASDAGHQVEFISLEGKKINFCIGCLACGKTQKCFQKDDAPAITECIRTADVVAFATPIYYYEMAGQLKTLLDRSNSLYNSDYSFRDIYLISTSMDSDPAAMDGATKGIEGWIACYEKARFAGEVRGTGINDAGEATSHQETMAAAYQLGKNC